MASIKDFLGAGINALRAYNVHTKQKIEMKTEDIMYFCVMDSDRVIIVYRKDYDLQMIMTPYSKKQMYKILTEGKIDNENT